MKKRGYIQVAFMAACLLGVSFSLQVAAEEPSSVSAQGKFAQALILEDITRTVTLQGPILYKWGKYVRHQEVRKSSHRRKLGRLR